ncbi:hypothetical protein GCM10023310_43090 [Paenibacillus vulneris]
MTRKGTPVDNAPIGIVSFYAKVETFYLEEITSTTMVIVVTNVHKSTSLISTQFAFEKK